MHIHLNQAKKMNPIVTADDLFKAGLTRGAKERCHALGVKDSDLINLVNQFGPTFIVHLNSFLCLTTVINPVKETTPVTIETQVINPVKTKKDNHPRVD